MEKRYYTPSIEEFHVGFEYESYEKVFTHEWDEGTNQWVKRIVLDVNKTTYEGGNGQHPAIYHVSINNRYEPNADWNKYIRVKYLDREDIESLGWVFLQKDDNWIDFRWNEPYYENDYEKEYNKLTFCKSQDGFIIIHNGQLYEDNEQFFEGIVKNKSMLRMIMSTKRYGYGKAITKL